MLPSFRLIAATFFCGFLMVYGGLRLATRFNDFHAALPVMAAHAAPISIAPVSEANARRSASPAPVISGLRFAVTSVSPNLVPGAPVYEPPTPPLSVVPPIAVESTRSDTALAAIPAETPAIAVPGAQPSGPTAEPLQAE